MNFCSTPYTKFIQEIQWGFQLSVLLIYTPRYLYDADNFFFLQISLDEKLLHIMHLCLNFCSTHKQIVQPLKSNCEMDWIVMHLHY